MKTNRRMQVSPFIFLSLVALIGAFITTASAQSGCIMEKVCLKVVSQRLMTEADIKRITPLSIRRSVVRLRLRNDSGNEIVYLTWLDSAEPVGYQLSRKKAETDFSFLPKGEYRTEFNLKSGRGSSFRYLRLPPNSLLEFDLPDWGNPRHDEEGMEHAFSIFIKLGGIERSDTPIELISDIFKPLSK